MSIAVPRALMVRGAGALPPEIAKHIRTTKPGDPVPSAAYCEWLIGIAVTELVRIDVKEESRALIAGLGIFARMIEADASVRIETRAPLPIEAAKASTIHAECSRQVDRLIGEDKASFGV